MPVFLGPDDIAAWRSLAPTLLRLGVLSEIDGTALAALVMTYGDMVRAKRDLDENGTTFTTEKGYEGPRPALKVYEAAKRELRFWLSEFGLTPASRTRVKVGKQSREAKEAEEARKHVLNLA